MALIRAIPLKDFLDTALSTTDAATVFSTVPPDAGESLYAALHLTNATTTARTLVMTVQAASSSGFGTLTTEVTFALSTGNGSTWQEYASPSTDQDWRRANWTLSTAASTDGTWSGLVYIGFR